MRQIIFVTWLMHLIKIYYKQCFVNEKLVIKAFSVCECETLVPGKKN